MPTHPVPVCDTPVFPHYLPSGLCVCHTLAFPQLHSTIYRTCECHTLAFPQPHSTIYRTCVCHTFAFPKSAACVYVTHLPSNNLSPQSTGHVSVSHPCIPTTPLHNPQDVCVSHPCLPTICRTCVYVTPLSSHNLQDMCVRHTLVFPQPLSTIYRMCVQCHAGTTIHQHSTVSPHSVCAVLHVTLNQCISPS